MSGRPAGAAAGGLSNGAPTVSGLLRGRLRGGQANQARIDAEHLANPIRREDLGRRAVADDPAAVEEYEAREKVRSQ